MARFLAIIIILSSFAVYSQKPQEQVSGSDLTKGVSVYPNPASDFINVKFEFADPNEVRLVLYTIIGTQVAIEPEILESREIRLKIKDLPSGFYILAFHHESTGTKSSRKFLKK
jgi:hypothetical protein